MNKNFLILLSALTLSACGGSSSIQETSANNSSVDSTGEISTPSGAENNSPGGDAVATNSRIKGNLTLHNDADPAGGITIALRGTDISTSMQPNGEFLLELPKTDASRTVTVDVSGTDVMQKSMSIHIPAQANQVLLDMDVAGRAPAVSFNLDSASELKNSSSATRVSVSVPANAFQFADGSVATGDAQVSITEIDIEDLYGESSWAPSLIGIPEGMTEPTAIMTFGMSDFHFSKDGQKLQLRPGVEAIIKMDLVSPYTKTAEQNIPVPAAGGTVMPLWHYDTQAMVWKEEGEATVMADSQSDSGFSASGGVSHFSTWNIDTEAPEIDAFVELVLVDLNGRPFTELAVETYTSTARIPAEDGVGWHDETGWFNTVNMTPENNRFIVMANLESRQWILAEGHPYISGYTTMEIIVENIVVSGSSLGEISSAPIKRKKIFRTYDGDNTIVIEVPVTLPPIVNVGTNVNIVLVDTQGTPRNDLTVESYSITTQTDTGEVEQQLLTPASKQITVLANGQNQIDAGTAVATQITLGELRIQGHGVVTPVFPVSQRKVFKASGDDNVVTLIVTVIDL